MTRTLEEQLTALGNAVEEELTTDFTAEVISLDDRRNVRDVIFPVVAALVLVVGGLFLVSELAQARRTVAVGPQASESSTITSTEPLPAPILVEDMTLSQVMRPRDPDFDADDLFGQVEISSGEAEFREEQRADLQGSIETVLYGDPDDPFNSPIFGITIFGDGSFQATAANLDARSIADLENQIVDNDGEVGLPAGSGLSEITRVTSETLDTSDFAWSFYFGATNRTFDFVTNLTAQTGPDPDELSEWTWISRLLPSGDEFQASTRTIDVLGQEGVLITYSGERPLVLVWSEAEVTYQYSALSFDSPEEFASGEVVASQLTRVDAAEWAEAVINSEPAGDALSTRVLIVLSLVAAAAFYLAQWRRSEPKKR